MRALQIGDRAKYRREFLRSIGAYAGDIPFARGEVVAITKLSELTTLAFITWDDETDSTVNVANLTLASDPERV